MLSFRRLALPLAVLVSFGSMAQEGETPAPLTLTPGNLVLAVGNPAQFEAKGGVPPYVFSLKSGSGTLNSETGAYVAPSEPGQAEIAVTDSTGLSAAATLTVN